MKKLIIAVGVLAATLFCIRPVTWARKNDVTRNLTVFNRLYKELTTFYVDSVDADKAITAAIEGMLGDIDPYTEYIPQKDRETFEAVSSGEYAGIGSYITTRGGDTFISEPSAGSPAAEAGLRAGDRLVVINGDSVRGMASDEVSKRLKGQPGTEVSITVWRPYVGADSVKTFRIKRRRIIDNSIPWHGIVRGSVGYIPITGFNEKTGTEFRDALLDLKKDPRLKALINDLRDNGGGLLESAVKVLGNFLPKGSEVLRMRYKGSAANEKIYKTTDKPVDTELPLAVLINEGTASASEILAGAIQDLDRGIIVGRRTFGKGLVQRPFPFPDGSMVRLTVARYYTPSGRCIQKPYHDGDDDAYRDDLINRYKHGEYLSEDSIVLPDSLKYYTLKLHRPVYGGGGILPDKFVPIDTTGYSTYYRDLMAKGVYNRIVTNYIDANRKLLKKSYKTIGDFISGFEISQKLIDDMVKLGEEEGVPYDEKGFETSKETILTILKGLIARDLFDQEAYWRVANHLDPVYLKAVEIFTTPGAYETTLSHQ